MATNSHTNPPILNVVASSARQLFLLLRCISFSSKAQVEIRPEGLRFTVEESRTIQGLAFLDKALFTSYSYHESAPADQEDEEPDPVIFQISLPALLETLQIFNIDTFSRSNHQNPGLLSNRPSAFSPQSLGTTNMCRLSYEALGSPLQLIMTEAGVTTTCNLSTYEPEFIEEIPIQKSDLAYKIILKSSLLHDALQELSSTSPTRLSIVISPQAPFFALSSSGPLGSATVEFTKDPSLLETFIVPRRTVNTYKYAMVKSAVRAMALANKVSVRGDEQGVMSLQFLIEGEGANGTPTFIDFRFVPFLGEDGDEDCEEDGVDAEFV
jgi:cell cycle checkpoint protein